MQYMTTRHVPVAAERAWAILADVRRWPDWTPTVTAVTAPSEALTHGQRVTITQPGRRPVHYTVEHLEPGHRFRWGSDHAGVRQWAEHRVTPDGDQRCTVELTFAMTGPLGTVVGLLGAGKIRKMVDAEAAALTTRLHPPPSDPV